MVATIAVDMYSVCIEGSQQVWKIPVDLVRCVGGCNFIKVKLYDQFLVRLVCGGLVEPPKVTKCTIVGCIGFKELMQMRNAVAFNAQQASEDDTESAAVKVSGEGASGIKQFGRHNPRCRAHQLRDLRDMLAICEVEFEVVAGLPGQRVMLLRPAHPCEDLSVMFKAECLDHIIAFIKSRGVDLASLTQRRGYGIGQDGAWKHGSAGLVKRVCHDEFDDGDISCPRKRFTTLANWMKPVAPIADEDRAGSVAAIEA